jgi:hypothetical protein
MQRRNEMVTKIFEIRDEGTYIPVMATKMKSDNELEQRYLRSTGYGTNKPLVVVTRMNGCESHYGPYEWSNITRTMKVAHAYIQEHFDELENCAVVDVEYILGETTIKKVCQFNEEE